MTSVRKTIVFRYQILEEDPRQRVIYQYVLKHDDCIKKELEDYMKRLLPEKPPDKIYASIKTVYKIVAEFVEKGVMIQSVNEKNRREVRLHINRKNGMIYNELEKIDKLISTLANIEPKLNKVRVEIILTMLRHLSYHMKRIKLSDFESNTFNREIIRLNRKISEQVYNPEYTKELLHTYKNKLVNLKLDPEVKKSSYDKKIIEELIKYEEEFNKKYLS